MDFNRGVYEYSSGIINTRRRSQEIQLEKTNLNRQGELLARYPNIQIKLLFRWISQDSRGHQQNIFYKL